MPAHLTIQGIQELKIALGNLPTDLKGQATQLVLDTAYAARAEIEAAYPIGPSRGKYHGGNLKKGVKVFIKEVGAFAVVAQVRSTAHHAWWMENGEKLNPRETKRKVPRGTMFSKKGIPPRVFIPTMIRYRNAMYLKLAELIRSTGLLVKFDEAA